jgi:hypothetical protein
VQGDVKSAVKNWRTLKHSILIESRIMFGPAHESLHEPSMCSAGLPAGSLPPVPIPSDAEAVSPLASDYDDVGAGTLLGMDNMTWQTGLQDLAVDERSLLPDMPQQQTTDEQLLPPMEDGTSAVSNMVNGRVMSVPQDEWSHMSDAVLQVSSFEEDLLRGQHVPPGVFENAFIDSGTPVDIPFTFLDRNFDAEDGELFDCVDIGGDVPMLDIDELLDEPGWQF